MRRRMIRWQVSNIIIGALLTLTMIACGNSSTLPPPTVTATITLSPSPSLTFTPSPSPTTTPFPISENGEAGFDVRLQTETLPADGYSTIPVEIVTTRSEFAGLPLILVPLGGGRIEPAEVTLPPLGNSLTVTYTSGEAASTVRIEGRTLRQEGESIDSATLQLELETFVLRMEYDAPVSETPLLIPVRVWLAPLPPTEKLRGQYAVQIRAVNSAGVFCLSPDSNETSTELQLFVTADNQQRVYFTPNEGNSAIIHAQVLGRGDVEGDRQVIYWTHLENRVQFSNLPDGATVNVPEGGERYFWALNGWNNACAWFYDASEQWIIPVVAQYQYEPLLIQPGTASHFYVRHEEILPDTWVRSDETGLDGSPYLFSDIPTCATFYIMQGGGLFRLKMSGALLNRAAQALLIADSDEITWTPLFINLSTTTPNIAAAIEWPASAIPIYRLGPVDAPAPQAVLFAVWIPSDAVDSVHSTLIGTGESQILTLIPDLEAYMQGTPPLQTLLGKQVISQIWIAEKPDGTAYTTSVSVGDQAVTLQRVYLLGWLN